MENKNYGIFLIFMLTLFNCGSLFFLVGFFPDSRKMTEDGGVGNNRPVDVNGLRVTPPQRQYDQIILMIVDALRVDFMTIADYMPFTHSKGCNILKLQAAVPTVTMPRIKSLTTGTLSNFIDIIRNLGDAEKLQDSIIHNLKRRGDMINFAGDDTWVQLFPSQFSRAAANNDSLYVNDFYKGDNNVKATLVKELNETDWSFLILHFLGLDHIGHVEGSNSVRIPGKLMEMDRIIRLIYENPFFDKRLLLVTGDHGMRNGGGHGGSSEEEVKVPLALFMPNCKQSKNSDKVYNQIDLTPTLAILFSVEIPKSSIGCLIPELLHNLTFEEKLYAYFYNAHHLLNKVIAKKGKKDINQSYQIWFEKATHAHRQFLEGKMKNISGVFHYEQALANYNRIAQNVSPRLSDALVTFDITLISLGLYLTSIITIYVMIFTLFAERKKHFKRGGFNSKKAFFSFMLAVIIIIFLEWELDNLAIDTIKKYWICVPFITIANYIAFDVLKAFQELLLPMNCTNTMKLNCCFPISPVICYLLNIILLASSSYIESESLSSHYLGCTCLLLLTIKILLQDVDIVSDNAISSAGRFFLKIHETKAKFITSMISFFILRLFRRPPEDSFLNDLYWFQLLKTYAVGLHFPLGMIILLLLHILKLATVHQILPCAFALLSVSMFRLKESNIAFIPSFGISSVFILICFWVSLCVSVLLGIKSFFRRNGFLYVIQTFLVSILMMTVLLHKPENVILLPSFLLILDRIYTFCDNLKLKAPKPLMQNYILIYKTIMTILMANMFFFYQGNTNSLATIDLNPGYIGQSKYNPITAAIFLTINTYNAPIIAFFYLIIHILKKNDRNTTSSDVILSPDSETNYNKDLRDVLTIYTTATMLPTNVYLGLMIVFRYHLFIYSVFAPKFFYEFYDVLVFYIVYVIIYLILYMYKRI